MKFCLSALLLLCSATTALAENAEELLPPDAPLVPELVHQLRFPTKRRLLVELGPSYLYGDKFLTTYGLGLTIFYHWSENWAAGLSGSGFRSKENEDIQILRWRGTPPNAYDPITSLEVLARYYPLYGKILAANTILRFKLFIEFGAHASREKVTSTNLITLQNHKKTSYGPNFALGIFVPVSDHFSFSAKFDFLFHPKMLDTENGWRHQYVTSIAGGYRFGL